MGGERTCPGCGLDELSGSEERCPLCGALLGAAEVAPEPAAPPPTATPPPTPAPAAAPPTAPPILTRSAPTAPPPGAAPPPPPGTPTVPPPSGLGPGPRPLGAIPTPVPQPPAGPVPGMPYAHASPYPARPPVVIGTPVNQKLEWAKRGVAIVVLLGLIGTGVVLWRNHQQAQEAERERAAYVAAHTGTTRSGPPSAAEVMQNRAALVRARDEAVYGFCRSPRPLPSQPAYVPGDLSQHLVMDGHEVLASTLGPPARGQADGGLVATVVCIAPSEVIQTGQSCDYSHDYDGDGYGDGLTPEFTKALAYQKRSIQAYELRTGKLLVTTTEDSNGPCPQRQANDGGPALLPLGPVDTAAWLRAHLQGGSYH